MALIDGAATSGAPQRRTAKSETCKHRTWFLSTETGGVLDQLILKLLRKNRVSLRLRVLYLQELEAFAEVAAGDLARAGFDVDVATDAMEKERERIGKAMAGVLQKQLRFPADAGLYPSATVKNCQK